MVGYVSYEELPEYCCCKSERPLAAKGIGMKSSSCGITKSVGFRGKRRKSLVLSCTRAMPRKTGSGAEAEAEQPSRRLHLPSV